MHRSSLLLLFRGHVQIYIPAPPSLFNLARKTSTADCLLNCCEGGVVVLGGMDGVPVVGRAPLPILLGVTQ